MCGICGEVEEEAIGKKARWKVADIEMPLFVEEPHIFICLFLIIIYCFFAVSGIWN